MNEKKIHYCFTLSEEQLEHLRSKKYKIDRMECFMSLVKLAERETKLVLLSKTQQVEILPGQVMSDNTRLAKLWNKDRKTVPKIIEAMEALGISSSQKVGENRIHTLHALSGWYVDGWFIKNHFATRRNSDGTAIVTAEVPPAKIITIEVSDDKDISGESPDSDSDNSHGGNAGVIPSADIPSSHIEADGSLKEGKGNDVPSAQQGELSPQSYSNPSDGSFGHSLKSEPDGFKSDR